MIPKESVFPISDRYHGKLGLSKRQLFAAMAMQGILTAHYSVEQSGNSTEATPAQIAQICVEHADALIGALRETQEK